MNCPHDDDFIRSVKEWRDSVSRRLTDSLLDEIFFEEKMLVLSDIVREMKLIITTFQSADEQAKQYLKICELERDVIKK